MKAWALSQAANPSRQARPPRAPALTGFRPAPSPQPPLHRSSPSRAAPSPTTPAPRGGSGARGSGRAPAPGVVQSRQTGARAALRGAGRVQFVLVRGQARASHAHGLHDALAHEAVVGLARRPLDDRRQNAVGPVVVRPLRPRLGLGLRVKERAEGLAHVALGVRADGVRPPGGVRDQVPHQDARGLLGTHALGRELLDRIVQRQLPLTHQQHRARRRERLGDAAEVKERVIGDRPVVGVGGALAPVPSRQHRPPVLCHQDHAPEGLPLGQRGLHWFAQPRIAVAGRRRLGRAELGGQAGDAKDEHQQKCPQRVSHAQPGGTWPGRAGAVPPACSIPPPDLHTPAARPGGLVHAPPPGFR